MMLSVFMFFCPHVIFAHPERLCLPGGVKKKEGRGSEGFEEMTSEGDRREMKDVETDGVGEGGREGGKEGGM